MTTPPFALRAIDHVVLRVVDLDRMAGFYREVLGCTDERAQSEIGLFQLRAGSSLIDLVTIDGKPVELAPDGSFRFHFVFPDGNYGIPIIATSPDGVETRSATLRFERGTARTGDVGQTAQPPLAGPMGAKV